VGFFGFRAPMRHRGISGSVVPANLGRSSGCDHKDSRCLATVEMA
jgi:hypothetical protein